MYECLKAAVHIISYFNLIGDIPLDALGEALGFDQASFELTQFLLALNNNIKGLLVAG